MGGECQSKAEQRADVEAKLAKESERLEVLRAMQGGHAEVASFITEIEKIVAELEAELVPPRAENPKVEWAVLRDLQQQLPRREKELDKARNKAPLLNAAVQDAIRACGTHAWAIKDAELDIANIRK